MSEQKKRDEKPTNLHGNDGARYVRQQKGHSLVLHILLIFVGVGMITIPYYSISKNHYWHL